MLPDRPSFLGIRGGFPIVVPFGSKYIYTGITPHTTYFRKVYPVHAGSRKTKYVGIYTNEESSVPVGR